MYQHWPKNCTTESKTYERQWWSQSVCRVHEEPHFPFVYQPPLCPICLWTITSHGVAINQHSHYGLSIVTRHGSSWRDNSCAALITSLIKNGILPLMSRVTQCVSTTPPTKKVSSLLMSVLHYAYTSGLSQRFGFTQQDFKDPTSGPNVVSFSGCCIQTERMLLDLRGF